MNRRPISSSSANNVNNHPSNDCVVVSVATSELAKDTTIPTTSTVSSSLSKRIRPTTAATTSSSAMPGATTNPHQQNYFSSPATTSSDFNDDENNTTPQFNNLLLDNTTNNLNLNNNSVSSIVYSRLSVLVSLLLLQSMSQFVLEAFENVVQANIVIPLFLTMLVGAGGNAGNQAAVRAIAMLAKGEFSKASRFKQILPFIKRECFIGVICALVLSGIGALRVFVHQVVRRGGFASDDDNSNTNNNNAVSSSSSSPSSSSISSLGDQASIGVIVLAITLSLFLIVALSAMIGVVLPFLFLRAGMSAEHAAPAIQVIMDVLGVFLTCVVCSILLPSAPVQQPQQQQSNSNGAPP